MLIDWFTVGAQLLNFLVLVWLMKRFLYKPILHAIDAREKKIEAELADADAKKQAAIQEQVEFKKKNEEFDKERATILRQAKDEAKAEGQRLLDEARQASVALSEKMQVARQNDAHRLNEAINRRAQKQVFAIARQVLTDLAGASLEDQMIDLFIQRLEHVTAETKALLNQAFKDNSQAATLHSSIDLSAAQHTRIERSLAEFFAAPITLKFATAPDLVGGIELSANGQRVGWSIANYLHSLEKSLGALVKVKEKPDVKAEPHAN